MSALYVSMAARVCSASNLARTTTWLPARSALTDQIRGPLWYSGPGITMQPVGDPKTPGAASSNSAGSPDTISFGRPVEPPDVGAFQAGEIASGGAVSSVLCGS